MKPNYNIMAAAIALVISGAITQKAASVKAEQIADELCVHESESLRNELAVMKQCVELFNAQNEAIKDWRTNA